MTLTRAMLIGRWYSLRLGRFWAFAPDFDGPGIGDAEGEWRRVFPGWYRLVVVGVPEGRP